MESLNNTSSINVWHSKKPLPKGSRFGRWTVIDPDAGRTKSGNRLALCKCECGNEGLVVSAKLKNGWSTSCGCYNKDRQRDLHLRHGLSDTPTHNIWQHMRKRCEKPSDPKYPNYGGRGIAVCERWQVFENFLEDMGERPSANHSIDRINNDGNYEPGNCRWATAKQQANNRTTSCFITAFGTTATLMQWSDNTGINMGTLRNRLLRSKWPVEKALTEPVKQNKKGA